MKVVGGYYPVSELLLQPSAQQTFALGWARPGQGAVNPTSFPRAVPRMSEPRWEPQVLSVLQEP